MADAAKLDNWHWTEKDISQLSKDKISELLTDFQIEDDQFICKLTGVNEIEGEATVNKKRSKTIFYYEWKIKGSWEVTAKATARVYYGRFKVSNLSEELNLNEIDVKFTLDFSSYQKLIDFLDKQGPNKIREQLEKYLTSMKQEYDP